MMLNNSDVICFLATKNPSRSREFFEEKLGLTLVSEDVAALVFRAHNTMLRIQKVDHVESKMYTVLGWTVADIRQHITDLAHRGVVFERYPGMQQDELGVWTSPGGAKVAWFRDPDGNILSLTQF